MRWNALLSSVKDTCAPSGDVAGSEGEAGLVDVAVESHAGESAEDGTCQADERCCDQGDDAAGGQVAGADRNPGEAVEAAQDVVLASGDGGDDRDDDGDDHGPQPHGNALAGAVEAGHPAGDVPAAVVGQEQDDQQDDPAGEADGRGVGGGVGGGLAGVGVGGDADGGAGSGEQSGEKNGRAGRCQPPEEGRSGLDAAVAFLLPVDHGAAVQTEPAGCVGDRGGAGAGVADVAAA